MRSILLVATLTFACGGEQNKPAEPAPTPAVETTLPAEAVEATTDAGAVPNTGDCVTECVASRQMQATSPEQIQRDCEARCSGDTQTP